MTDVPETTPLDPAARTIGPFRLHEEIGRGAQGVVYRATDTRLGRPVALKVMEALGNANEDVLARFRREATAAAKLDHPGICTVYEASVVDRVPFIAMRLVDGESLARRISTTAETARGSSSSVGVPVDTRAVVRFFAKAARALHAAHEAGIIHRDIKPGNIMVATDGDPVIMDFGLAHVEDDDASVVTRTGDLFGTPAYMSPEQLTRQTIRLDRRTDVWSLGVTLYESMTLARPFDAPTRQALYQTILTKEPPSPRRLNPAIQKDLAAILETALQKDLDLRYQTAGAMACDLEAFLAGKPVAASRTGPAGRLLRWSRREPAKAALLLVLLLALPAIAVLVTNHVANRANVERARLHALQEEKDRHLSSGSLELGEGDAERAIGHFELARSLEGGAPEAAAGIAMAHLRKYRPLEALATLDAHAATLQGRRAALLLRADALRQIGRKADATGIERLAPEPRDALDFFLVGERLLQEGEAGREAAFREALQPLTQAIFLSTAPRALFFHSHAHAAGHAKDGAAAREAARALRQHWPRSAVASFYGGFALAAAGHLDEAITAYREALRLDPDLGHAQSNLGEVLRKKGQGDEAIAVYRDVIRRHPDLASGHFGLGIVLGEKGLHDETIPAFRKAIALRPGHAETHYNLGIAASQQDLLEDSIAAWRETIRLKPDHAEAHHNLAGSLVKKGLIDEAIAHFREALRISPDFAKAHGGLGYALQEKGLLDESIAANREAIRLKPDFPDAHHNLGHALRDKGLHHEAIAAFSETVRLQPELATAHCNLGGSLRSAGRFREALEAFRRGHELGARRPDWNYPSRAWVAEAEALVAQEATLERHLARGTAPDDARELAQLASLALIKGDAATAATFYRSAFAKGTPAAAELALAARLDAARAAILAARAAGDTRAALDAEARAAWRNEARLWLEQDLDQLQRRLEADEVGLEEVKRTMALWSRERDLAGVRDPTEIQKLPTAEQEPWRALWQRVEALRSAGK